MSFESSSFPTQELIPPPTVDIENKYKEFVPQEFLNDPSGYFEREGKNVKTGEVVVDEAGRVREDPTAVKDLPAWKGANGKELLTVGRRVNTAKGKVAESGDPFYEYKILKKLQEMGLPAATPVATAEQSNNHIMIMERIPGMRWSEREALELKSQGYSDADIESIKIQAQQKMDELQAQFKNAGVIRGWKLKDMVFQIDIPNRKILNIVPTDWERTKIIEVSQS